MMSFENKAVPAIFALLLLFAAGCDKLDREKFGKLGKTDPPAAASAPLQVTPAAPATPLPTIQLPDFTKLVAKQGLAVVNVSVTQAVARRSQLPNIPEDDPFFDFFRRFIPQPRGGDRGGEPEVQSGLGSGFIISADGYILTNRHVVADADTVTVRLTDKREFKANVVGTDKRTDVALLKIEAKDLPTVPIGNASQVQAGEWVLAIGSPFGFENSVTAGIVSAVNRALPDENYVPFIQTDAAINPGNSGGPLFNMKGEVIGINSQIYSRTGGFMGLSFAIPIDVAIDVANQLKTTGKVARGRIGVQIQSLNAELAGSFGLPDANGALVASVEAGSPADKAGVKAGDVIREFDGKKVVSSNELPRIVGLTKPGTVAKMTVWRKGQSQELSLTVVELPGERTASRSDRPSKAADRLGLALSESSEGLVIDDVRGPAARAGLHPGDVVLAVNNQRVEDIDSFRDIVARTPKGRSVALLVQRDGNTLFVPVRPEG